MQCRQIEGAFEGKRSDVAFARGDRVDVVRHKDNLKMEGEFHVKKDEVQVSKGERAVVKKHEDNLKLVKKGGLMKMPSLKADRRPT